MLKFIHKFFNFKRDFKSAFLKIAAQAFDGGDFLNIFVRF